MNTEIQMEGTLIVPDFSGVQDRVGPGIYKVRVTSAKPGKWEGKDGKPDTPFLNWRMETFDEAEGKNNGRSIFHRTPTAGGGAFRLQDFYYAATGDKAATGEDLKGSFDYTTLYGREVEVTIAEQTGKPEYTEVKSVRAVRTPF